MRGHVRQAQDVGMRRKEPLDGRVNVERYSLQGPLGPGDENQMG